MSLLWWTRRKRRFMILMSLPHTGVWTRRPVSGRTASLFVPIPAAALAAAADCNWRGLKTPALPEQPKCRAGSLDPANGCRAGRPRHERKGTTMKRLITTAAVASLFAAPLVARGGPDGSLKGSYV